MALLLAQNAPRTIACSGFMAAAARPTSAIKSARALITLKVANVKKIEDYTMKKALSRIRRAKLELFS